MMNRALAVAAALLAFAAAQSGVDDLNEVMHLLAARRHGEVSFIEQRFLSVVKRPLESSGELIFDAPGHLEKRTLEPRPESLVVEGGEVTVQRGAHRRVMDLKSYPQIAPFVESIRATLAGDRAALERVFRVQFAGTVDHWGLLLVPLEVGTAAFVSQVQLDGTRGELLRVETRMADGDRSLLTLRARPGR